MKVYNFDSLCQSLYNQKNFIDCIKATNIKPIGFNTLEGNRYIVNVKIITKQGYKNKLLQAYINSSYLDDSLTEISNECLSKYLNNCLM
nr:MAG TPA: hypothetical protein [Caudoviricetes sp.]